MPAVELNPAEESVLVEVDLECYQHPPFLGEEGFPTSEHMHAAEELNRAYRSNGFVLLSNFGPSIEVLNEAFHETKELFKLPMEHKTGEFKQFNFAEDGMIIGYRGFGTENLNRNRIPDYKESFQLNAYDMQDANNLRGTPESYRKAMKAFVANMEDGARRMSTAFALGLGLEPDYFVKHLTDLSKNVCRSVHYPPSEFNEDVLNDIGDGNTKSVRVSEHCDISMMTFVFTDSPGLQLRVEKNGEGSWASIPVPQGATAVVNTGAMLKRWTNDLWRITTHRCVLENKEQASKDRYSCLYFNNPDHNTNIEAHPSLVPEGEKPKYAPISAGEHLLEMRNKIVGKRD